MHERREIERNASDEGLSVWDYLKRLNSPEEQTRIAQEKQAEAQSAAQDSNTRMQKEKGKLMLLIPQAETASDLVRAMSANPYGLQFSEVQGMFEARWKQLEQAGKMMREGEDSTQLAAQYEDAVKKVNEISSLLGQASNSNNAPSTNAGAAKQSLRKTQRGQMEQAVWIAGLVHHRYDARDLTDEQLISLHQQALPILEMQAVRRDTESALREARAAKEEAQQAQQEAQRARSGW